MLTTEELSNRLATSFPANADCWSQATDEVRDMSRYARECLGLDETYAVNFRSFRTPSEWNEKGVGSIVAAYRIMSDNQRRKFLKITCGWY